MKEVWQRIVKTEHNHESIAILAHENNEFTNKNIPKIIAAN